MMRDIFDGHFDGVHLAYVFFPGHTSPTST